MRHFERKGQMSSRARLYYTARLQKQVTREIENRKVGRDFTLLSRKRREGFSRRTDPRRGEEGKTLPGNLVYQANQVCQKALFSFSILSFLKPSELDPYLVMPCG